ncbi:LysM peptidoglycan-binding domain-containing protein [Nostoc sp. FACHB-892]|uniref:LysM peptidoglycan-binding domain-containing protein n=1 Tax=Nostoc sp. FACHB-892 TaxID=2692843 RepID=UPI0016886E78|nr:LysM peptidoglycan-binding domain-containing protein [Nostoc sp. FACHB-892]MBD2731778.1 LysM peptidoglycan-binding domain-containing protein [Nostoc sp. FACHB-892]
MSESKVINNVLLFSRINEQEEASIVGGYTYTVKRGDSLFKIAKRYCGKGNKWTQIYKDNKRKIGSNPDLIRPGQKLYLRCSGIPWQ